MSNSYYEVELTVVDSSSFTSSMTVTKIYVKSPNIIVSILGGSERSVKQGKSIVVDASRSRLDGVFDSNFDSSLQYAWSCIQISHVYSSTCLLFVNPQNAPVATIYSSNATISSKFNITVTSYKY